MRSVLKTDQEKAEIEAAERRERREGGFTLAKERDQNWKYLYPVTGGRAVMAWGLDESQQLFKLVIDGKTTIFRAEEFRQALRWV